MLFMGEASFLSVAFLLLFIVVEICLSLNVLFYLKFGESHLKRLVRILQTEVMVRVGGGWEDLESFVRKHDPCRGKRCSEK